MCGMKMGWSSRNFIVFLQYMISVLYLTQIVMEITHFDIEVMQLNDTEVREISFRYVMLQNYLSFIHTAVCLTTGP
jgi:hypothetical protein